MEDPKPTTKLAPRRRLRKPPLAARRRLPLIPGWRDIGGWILVLALALGFIARGVQQWQRGRVSVAGPVGVALLLALVAHSIRPLFRRAPERKSPPADP